MSLPPPRHESFKIRLRRAIDEEGLTIAEVARRLDPDDPSRGERNLYRWLSRSSTMLPSRASREALARALGREPDFFDPKLGVAEALEIARAYAVAELHEEVVNRRLWAPPGGPFGGWYLTREQRELLEGDREPSSWAGPEVPAEIALDDQRHIAASSSPSTSSCEMEQVA